VSAEDALARTCANALLARDRPAQNFGIVIEESRAGFARLSMSVGEAMIMGHGIAHGGVIFTFADTAFGYACNSRNVRYVALDVSISFVAPARLGDRLEAVAQERSMRGRTGVYDITVTRAASELVAVFRGTCYRIAGAVIDEGEGSREAQSTKA
jgi:acyl-CoA thioesterase